MRASMKPNRHVVWARLRRLVADDGAQELVEYAMLGAFVALFGALLWKGIVLLLADRYTEYNTNVPQYWEPPDPAGGGS